MVLVILSTPDDLYTLMVAPAAGPSGTFSLSDDYELSNSIDMSGYPQPAKSIGYGMAGIQGNFDGKGFSIIIDTIDTLNYNAFFYQTNNIVQNLTIIYKNDGIYISNNNINVFAGFISSAFLGSIINCHLVFGNNVTIGNSSTAESSGAFIATSNAQISNCSLTAGNNLTINSYSFAGGFCSRNNGSTNNCQIIIGNNLTINGNIIGGISGFSSDISNCSITIGDNCSFQAYTLNGATRIGGIIGETNSSNATVTNIKAIYGINSTFRGNTVGGVISYIASSNNIVNNTIILFKNSTNILGNIGPISSRRAAALIGIGNLNSNVFGLFNDYSINGLITGSIAPSVQPSSVLTNSCGNPLPGSNVTNMSTTSLETIINYLQTIPYLATLIPYIQQTYCYTPSIGFNTELNISPAYTNSPICPCTANLCNSNPQTTQYSESEDKSRIADQVVRSDFDVKLAEMQAGIRVSGMPIFKSYQDMMMWKQGACKYRR